MGRSVQARMKLTAEIINNFLKVESIVDIGCGSGRLFRKINWENFEWGIGLDLAESAISEAVTRNKTSKVTFQLFNLGEQSLPPADCYVALGLLDWLKPEEIKELFRSVKDKFFIFSFSEKKPSLKLYAHWLFRTIRAFFFREKLVPKYYSVNDILSFHETSYAHSTLFLSQKAMAFGSLYTNLPLASLEHLSCEIRKGFPAP